MKPSPNKPKLPLVSYFSEVSTELVKVTWPNKKQVARWTAIVVVSSVVTGAYLGGLDYIFVELIRFLLNR